MDQITIMYFNLPKFISQERMQSLTKGLLAITNYIIILVMPRFGSLIITITRNTDFVDVECFDCVSLKRQKAYMCD